MRYIRVLILIAGLLLSGMATTTHAAQIRIAAAASLTEAIKAAIAAYASIDPDAEILPNFASSGALARQLSSGAPADIYISANPKWMEYLKERNLIAADSVVTLVRNSLVMVGMHAAAGKHLKDLTTLQRIAIGSPASVPAGRYAQETLTNVGIYTRLQQEQRLILAKDVRQALLYADRGEVDGAFVYGTDARMAHNARVLIHVDPALHQPIIYPAAITAAGRYNSSALDFFKFLQQEAGRKIFRDFGFIVADIPAH